MGKLKFIGNHSDLVENNFKLFIGTFKAIRSHNKGTVMVDNNNYIHTFHPCLISDLIRKGLIKEDK